MGCVLDDVELGDKRCPCGIGWVCDETRNVCTRIAPREDAGPTPDGAPLGPDAGVDGGRDAGTAQDAGERDAGRRDAGGPDAAAPDAGYGGDTACGTTLSAAMFCDGFEDGADFASWSEGASERTGIVRWVNDPTFRGRGAMRAEMTGTSGSVFLETLLTETIDGGDLWFRTYVYVPASETVDHYDFVSIGDSSNSEAMALAFTTNATPFVWITEIREPFRSSMSIPRDTWTCLEVHLGLSDTAGTVELYVDGTLVQSASAVDTQPSEPIGSLAVGIPWANPSQPGTALYFDEVALGSTRLPCDP